MKSAKTARADGFVVMVLGALGFVAINFLFLYMARRSENTLIDFKSAYIAGRCLLQNLDPYSHENLLRVFQGLLGEISSGSSGTYVREVATMQVYFPSAFAITVPLATLPFGIAEAVWVMLTAASCLVAAFLVWDLAAEAAPLLSATLLCFYFLNAETSIIWGNAAGLAVSLCIIAVWCFLRERYVPVGIVCLAVSLALKPHDSGLVWLFFLLAGRVHRRRAGQTLAVLAALTLPFALWIWRLAPHWIGEMNANYAALFARGAIDDPGPAAGLVRGACLITSLQTVFSVIWDDPRFYNLASYAVCLLPVGVWIRLSIRTRGRLEPISMLLAAAAALSQLPTYHRIYDAKLVILAVPACALLWAKGGRMARLALLVTLAGLILTADLPWAAFLAFISWLHPAVTGWPATVQVIAKAFPVPLVLLCMGVFYLVAASKAQEEKTPISVP